MSLEYSLLPILLCASFLSFNTHFVCLAFLFLYKAIIEKSELVTPMGIVLKNQNLKSYLFSPAITRWIVVPHK